MFLNFTKYIFVIKKQFDFQGRLVVGLINCIDVLLSITYDILWFDYWIKVTLIILVIVQYQSKVRYAVHIL